MDYMSTDICFPDCIHGLLPYRFFRATRLLFLVFPFFHRIVSYVILDIETLDTSRHWLMAYGPHDAMTVFNTTSGQRILTKCHIAVLSPLAAANGFVRC